MRDIEAGRALTPGECSLATSVFGDALHTGPVRIVGRKWWPLQPRGTVMAPDGKVWVHPESPWMSADYSSEPIATQALFIHELTHVWQVQRWGRWHLLLLRHPFCRYRYRLVPGRPFARYGLEQQAEMVRHLFLLRRGSRPAGAASLEALEKVVPFRPPAICAARS
jgi:hypothetical protein